MSLRSPLTARLPGAVFVLLFIPVFTVVIAEAILRLFNPAPPVQVVRSEEFSPVCMDGQILWFEGRDRTNSLCADFFPDAELVVFSGDSIFFGAGISDEQVFTRLIQESLDERFGRGAVCIINLSQPAYSFGQKLAWLIDFMSDRRVGHVFWESWPNEGRQFTAFGSRIFSFGVPGVLPNRLPQDAPIPASEWLFENSSLYRYIYLTALPRDVLRESWFGTEYVPAIEELREMLAGRGTGITMVPAARLDRPFGESNGDSGDIETWFRNRSDVDSFSVVYLSDIFRRAGSKVEDVRLDTCCHFNPEGHRVLAKAFEKLIVDSMPSAGRDRKPGSEQWIYEGADGR